MNRTWARYLMTVPQDTIVGTDASETLTGTLGDDSMAGLGGADLLNGRDGRDTLDGGNGKDTLHGGQGRDVLQGGGNNDDFVDEDRVSDTFHGGEGKDRLIADWSYLDDDIVWVNTAAGKQDVAGHTVSGIESLVLTLGSGNDLIDNSAVQSLDDIHAGSGRDTIDGGKGFDFLYGDGGNDTLMTSGSGRLYGGTGQDLLISAWTGTPFYGTPELHGGRGDDTVLGGSAGDGLFGEEGHDSVDGGAGNDAVYIMDSDGDGGDTLVGGDGRDVLVSWNRSSETPVVWFNDPTQVQTVLGSQVTGFEAIALFAGTAGNDHVTNLLTDTGDHFRGGAGNDTFAGGAGNDALEGEAGDDVLIGGIGDDVMDGHAGANIYVFDSQIGMDTVHGLSGVDKFHISQAGLPVGNGDAVIDGAVEIDGPGGFSTDAELVLVTTLIDGAISLEAAAEVIGSADSRYAVGDTAIFVVSNGVTGICYFQSADDNAEISVDELSFITYFHNSNYTDDLTALDDYVFVT